MKLIDKILDKLLEIGRRFFPTPEPEITNCPYCKSSLSRIIQCHYKELNRPEFFYICNGNDKHVFGTQQELRKAVKEIQIMKNRKQVIK